MVDSKNNYVLTRANCSTITITGNNKLVNTINNNSRQFHVHAVKFAAPRLLHSSLLNWNRNWLGIMVKQLAYPHSRKMEEIERSGGPIHANLFTGY